MAHWLKRMHVLTVRVQFVVASYLSMPRTCAKPLKFLLGDAPTVSSVFSYTFYYMGFSKFPVTVLQSHGLYS
jgi:hypothetical protein